MPYSIYQRNIYRTFNSKKWLLIAGFFHFSASCHCGLQASCIERAASTATLAVIISLLQHKRHFNGVGMPLNPELWREWEKAKKKEHKNPQGPVFLQRVAYCVAVRELPTGEHNHLTSDWSEWQGRQLGPNHRDRLPTLPTSTRPLDVSLGHRWMLFFFLFFIFPPPSPFCRKGTAAPLCCGTSRRKTNRFT